MLPTLFTNVNQKVYDAREQNIVQKVTQAMNQMKALGLLSQTYDSTEDFVDELTKHLKVTKVCKKNLENCWPTKTVTDANGEEFDVSTVKTSENINKKYFGTNAVGLVLADGAHIILAYNKSATPILETEATRPEGNTTNSTQSIAFVMDVNGGRGPNTENSTKDIRGFHSASFAKSSKVYNCTGKEFELSGKSVCYLGTDYNAINCSKSASSTEDYKTYCGTPSGWSNDYLAGAKKACEEIGMKLPDKDSLKSLYDKKSEAPSDVTLSGWFWSASEDSYGYPYVVNVDNGNTTVSDEHNQIPVLCSGS